MMFHNDIMLDLINFLAMIVVIVSLIGVTVMLTSPKPIPIFNRFDGSKWAVWLALQKVFGVGHIDGVWFPGPSGKKIYDAWFMMPEVTRVQSKWLCEFIEVLKQVAEDTVEERMKAYPIGTNIEWDSEGNYKLIPEKKNGEADTQH